jgi:hypothetical protein
MKLLSAALGGLLVSGAVFAIERPIADLFHALVLTRELGRTRGSTLLVRVEDVVLCLHFHMARVSAI